MSMERPSVIESTDGYCNYTEKDGIRQDQWGYFNKLAALFIFHFSQQGNRDWATNLGCYLAFEMICRENCKERLEEEEEILRTMPILERQASYPPPGGVPSDITEEARSSSGSPPPIRKSARRRLYQKRKMERIFYLKRQLRNNATMMLIGLVIHNTGSPCTIPMIHSFFNRYFAEFVLSYDEDKWWKAAIMKALDHCRDNRTLDKMDWPLGGVAYTKGTTFDAFYRHWERKRTILRPYLTENDQLDEIFYNTLDRRGTLEMYKKDQVEESDAWLNRMEMSLPRRRIRRILF